jgi:hypothetical protein
VLSRLISLLSRIPAVKWAFNRLRPLPHSGSLDVAAIAADNTAVSVIAESPSAAPTDISAGDDSSVEPPAEVEPVIEEEVSTSSVDVASETVDAPELIGSDPSPQPPANVEPVVEELVFIASAETETVLVEPSELVTEDEPASVASAEIEPAAVDETPVIVVDAEAPAPVVAEETIADAPVAATDIAPASPAPKSPSAPKARAKAVEPADRAALIRQRWAETGIRMWNPRLHGTGDATLNIQGRIGLLPPEPGETMPRYDKLEFKMLGGQIVCEGVIVEAPVHAGQRSFTRLAEPRGADRTREAVRERQAALA